MKAAPSLQQEPLYANTGHGPSFSVLEVGLPSQVAVVEANTAFWALVSRDSLQEALSGRLVKEFRERAESFREEMQQLRFGLKPSAAYFNPTERCNLNCSYCYLPQDMRRSGKTMTPTELCEALDRLCVYFKTVLPQGVKPQLIFHGSEPMLAREAVFAGIERFDGELTFGLQTNGTLLDDSAIDFLKMHRVGIGISLDAPSAEIADLTRKTWNGSGVFEQVVEVMKKLADYPAFNVITTVTEANVKTLPQLVEFYHEHGVRVVMLNPVRLTQEGGRALKPSNEDLSAYFLKALDRTYELFQETGRKLVVANFANVLAGVIGPTGRRLMCDISPCGGGRCFVAVSATGDVFPCSELIGFPAFKGGSLYESSLSTLLKSEPFQAVTQRMVESISPCRDCAIRHFCGAPCPAEVHATTGALDAPAPYCEFYEEQVRYVFRVIARGREEAYLWDGFHDETEDAFILG